MDILYSSFFNDSETYSERLQTFIFDIILNAPPAN